MIKKRKKLKCVNCDHRWLENAQGNKSKKCPKCHNRYDTKVKWTYKRKKLKW